MRILLSNNHLSSVGGTERWTETMFCALKRLGHEVHVFTFTENRLFNAPSYSPEVSYDLALVNHNTCLRYLREAKNIGKIIFTSHGVIPKLEKAEEGADVYVGVSEEVVESMPFDAHVIRNPIDLCAFRRTKPISNELKRVLFISTKPGKARDVVEEACQGLELKMIGRGNVSSHVWDDINGADLVIGLGRSAYEAMACGRNVVVYDYNGGDGFVTEENFERLRKRNLSGRTHQRHFTPEELRAEMNRYDPSLDLRPLVSSQGAPLVAQAYLALA